MKAFLGIVILNLCVIASAQSLALSEPQRLELHSASKNLEAHVEYEALVEQYFEPFKQRVFVTNQALTKKERNQKIRKYLKERYFPRLVFNYGVIY